MTMPIILILIGIFLLFLSLFTPSTDKKIEKRIEQASISLHNDTNDLKRRVKALEKNLLTNSPEHFIRDKNKKKLKTKRPIHAIIINQVLALYTKGYDTKEIAKRAALSEAEVIEVLISEEVKK